PCWLPGATDGRTDRCYGNSGATVCLMSSLNASTLDSIVLSSLLVMQSPDAAVKAALNLAVTVERQMLLTDVPDAAPFLAPLSAPAVFLPVGLSVFAAHLLLGVPGARAFLMSSLNASTLDETVVASPCVGQSDSDSALVKIASNFVCAAPRQNEVTGTPLP